MSDPFGAKSAKRAAKAGEEANTLTVRAQNLRSARQRRELVREARIARAEAENAGVVQGVANSSVAQGGLGALETQFQSNLSFLDNQSLITDQTSAALGRQRKYQAKAARSRAIWNFGAKLVGEGIKAVATGGAGGGP